MHVTRRGRERSATLLKGDHVVSFLVLMMAAAVASGDASTQQAPAAAQPAPASAKPAKAEPDPDHVVCRKEEVTGSRFVKRICMPQSEWDAQTAQAQRNQAIISQRTGLGAAMGGVSSGGGQ
jgi:hypothetical protein